LGCNDLFL